MSAEKQAVLEENLLRAPDAEKLLIYVTLYTGLRIGEACALRWEDVDLKSRTIYIRQTVSRIWCFEDKKRSSKLIIGPPKTTSSYRCVPICSKLLAVLNAYPYRNKSGYILSDSQEGSYASPRTFECRFKKILLQSGLDSINYHALRHTFATRCIEKGVDIKSLSEILGHADVSTTLNTYVHSSMELKRLQIEKLAL